MYVQIPANPFYFTLGIFVGVIGFLIFIYIVGSRADRKNKENITQFVNELNKQREINNNNKTDKD